MRTIAQIFVAFSEKLNFIWPSCQIGQTIWNNLKKMPYRASVVRGLVGSLAFVFQLFLHTSEYKPTTSSFNNNWIVFVVLC
mgnify:CR=1 FL=1